MKNHTKVYLQFFDLCGQEFIQCECCNERAVDIHHIEARGMGGSQEKDRIENLMALCRACHIAYGDIELLKPMLTKIHRYILKNRMGGSDKGEYNNEKEL